MKLHDEKKVRRSWEPEARLSPNSRRTGTFSARRQVGIGPDHQSNIRLNALDTRLLALKRGAAVTHQVPGWDRLVNDEGSPTPATRGIELPQLSHLLCEDSLTCFSYKPFRSNFFSLKSVIVNLEVRKSRLSSL